MTTDTNDRILSYIATNKQARPHDLVKAFRLSQVAIHRQLNKLLGQNKILKIGRPPLVFYVLTSSNIQGVEQTNPIMRKEIEEYINTNYLYITPQGNLLYGVVGFQAWARAIKEEKRMISLGEEYVTIHKSLERYRTREGLIDATDKLRMTFDSNIIDKLFYADFYSIEKFGKTKLGQYVLYAKQSQNKELIDEIVLTAKPLIERIIEQYQIDTVMFIPPSVPRKLQFMQEFREKLQLHVPVIDLVKTYSNIIVPQKTLAKLEERVANARDTIFTKSLLPVQTQKILLIDDAVGSGATLIETAKKLSLSSLSKKKIYGFAIVGSIKGFEVIREV